MEPGKAVRRQVLFALLKSEKNKPMKKILFPTDFSATSNKAFIYALNIADHLGATITTLHVYQKPIEAQNYPGVDTQEIFKDFDLAEFQNYKDALQEWTQGKYKLLPTYKVKRNEDLNANNFHERFIAQAWFQGKLLGEGKGGSKKEAQQAAAKQAYDYVKSNEQ